MDIRGVDNLNWEMLHLVDYKKGLENAKGQGKEYIEMMSLFAFEYEEKKKELEAVNGDYGEDTYLLWLHRLRMAANILFVPELLENVRKAEEAERGHDFEKKRELFQTVTALYGKTVEEIKDFLEENESWLEKEQVVLPTYYVLQSQKKEILDDKRNDIKKEIDNMELLLQIQDLYQLIDNYEKDMAKEKIDWIYQYRLSETIEKCLGDAKKNLDYFQYDEALEAVEQIKQELVKR